MSPLEPKAMHRSAEGNADVSIRWISVVPLVWVWFEFIYRAGLLRVQAAEA